MGSSVRRASLIVAASVGAVEALKDQAGLCRWNLVLRSMHQHANNNIGSLSQTSKRRMPSSSVAASCFTDRLRKEEKAKQSEESLRKVMYLSCWGPN